MEDAQRLFADHIDHGLIVFKTNHRPTDSFRLVLFLLLFEDVLVEEQLQRLVGEVDAQLLERIFTEILKTKNVENGNGFVGLIKSDDGVDFLH